MPLIPTNPDDSTHEAILRHWSKMVTTKPYQASADYQGLMRTVQEIRALPTVGSV